MIRNEQMIARKWHGSVPAAKSDEYLNRMRKVALLDYKSIRENRGAFPGNSAGTVARVNTETYQAIPTG